MTSMFPITQFIAQAADTERGRTWLEIVQQGGVVAFLIILLSVAAVVLIVMHLFQLRRSALLPPDQIETLDGMLGNGDVNGALNYCLEPDADSYLTRILGSGLTRFQKSAFGVFEIKNAIEEAGEDQTARLYRSTDALGVIGTIAPLMGLLGTVLGMVGAFNSLSRSANNNEQLAGSISMALVTTLMGLILAIPCIALHTYFRNRIDTFASEAAMEIERLILHLESDGVAPPARPAAPGPRSAPPRAAAASPAAPTTAPNP